MTSSQSRIDSFSSARILVLGDLMLDRFITGTADRISPEAPIAVVAVETVTSMAGGAGNVARNVAALGGKAVLIGLVGDDAAGQEFRQWADAEDKITADLVVSHDRPTTQKIRYVANRQQLLRADIEKQHPAEVEAEELLARFMKHLPEVGAVVLSDYGKGVLCDKVLSAVIGAARQARKPIVLDPKRTDVRAYDGVTVLTPNRAEAARATHIAGDGDGETAEAAEALLAALPATPAVLVTRGSRGMTLLERGKIARHIFAAAREVFDVSGAGDTVVAGLALTLASGGTLDEGAQLANMAAGLVVAKAGTATVTADELSGAIFAGPTRLADRKILSRSALADQLIKWRSRGERIGFTNGCFDLIHPGHLALLGQARTECDRLVVGLNNDASVKRLKGASRPVQSESARAIVLASLEVVDAVALFGDDTPLELIQQVRPDVLVKGADYRLDQVVGAEFVKSYGGRIVLAELVPGQSTTRIVTKMAK